MKDLWPLISLHNGRLRFALYLVFLPETSCRLKNFSLRYWEPALSWKRLWTIAASFRNNLSFTFSHLSDELMVLDGPPKTAWDPLEPAVRGPGLKDLANWVTDKYSKVRSFFTLGLRNCPLGRISTPKTCSWIELASPASTWSLFCKKCNFFIIKHSETAPDGRVAEPVCYILSPTFVKVHPVSTAPKRISRHTVEECWPYFKLMDKRDKSFINK